MKYYSKSTGGFYTAEIHGENIPSDAIEITDEYHAELLEGQSAGKAITSDNSGYPVLTERLPPTIEEQRAAMSCAAWQFKRALTALGLRAMVEAEIAAADLDTQDMWQAPIFRRLNPRIVAMAVSLGQSDDDLDALFDLALTFNE